MDCTIEELHGVGTLDFGLEQDGAEGFRGKRGLLAIVCIDIADHGETGYDFTPSGGSGGGGAFAMAGLTGHSTIDADGKADVSQKVAG